MSSILNEIAAYKRNWVDTCKQHAPITALEALAANYTPLNFSEALQSRVTKRRNAVIAEVKKASPSKGIIREDFDPVAIARGYEQSGAACLSVLTDVKYFQGQDQYVRDIRAAVDIPILRKDFMLDPYQLVEARAMGADCILIIMAMVDDALADRLCRTAQNLGLSVLPEVHNEAELERALQLDTPLLGINNRDLHSFNTTLDTTYRMLSKVPEERVVITESGIFTHADIAAMNAAGVYGFLVGESLMRQADPGLALQQLLGSPAPA